MFNRTNSGVAPKTQENIKKDFKKVANYVNLAKGRRNVNSFAADMKTNSEYLTLVINAKIVSYPTMPYLKMIADNSEGRVSLKDLTLACGYSNYANNDMEQIKNVYVRRGFIPAIIIFWALLLINYLSVREKSMKQTYESLAMQDDIML